MIRKNIIITLTITSALIGLLNKANSSLTNYFFSYQINPYTNQQDKLLLKESYKTIYRETLRNPSILAKISNTRAYHLIWASASIATIATLAGVGIYISEQ